MIENQMDVIILSVVIQPTLLFEAIEIYKMTNYSKYFCNDAKLKHVAFKGCGIHM